MIVETAVPTMIVETAVPTRVVGTATQEILFPQSLLEQLFQQSLLKRHTIGNLAYRKCLTYPRLYIFQSVRLVGVGYCDR